MKIEMTERELVQFANNVIKQSCRLVRDYCNEADINTNEKDTVIIEPAHLIEEMLSMPIEMKNIIQPKN